MPKIDGLVLEGTAKTIAEDDSESITEIQFFTRSTRTGRLESVFQLTGNEEDWDSLIHRLKKQLESARLRTVRIVN